MSRRDVSEQQCSENEDGIVHISQEGNITLTSVYLLNVHVCSCYFIVTSDMTCDETDQGVGPEEETLIQEAVHRLDDPSTPSTGTLHSLNAYT